MKSKIVTTIPTYNSGRFLQKTLESLARQTLRPDRVVVLDDGSSDDTEAVVRGFTEIKCEFIRTTARPGLFENFNRCLGWAEHAEFLHILHADDTVKPEFYETMVGVLAGTQGRGMAWCVDERIDENDRHLNFSGKTDGRVELLTRDQFLRRKAEIGNQAFCATLLRTNYQPSPSLFPLDYPIVGDMVLWAAFGSHCDRIVHVHRALANYRWHGDNQTLVRAPTIQSLILDEWRTMETNEALRGRGWSVYRKMKLKGLMAVRSGIKAKRVRQNGDPVYSREIVKAASGITGQPLWLAGQVLVELRDFYLFKIQRRARHPKNIYG